MGRCVVLCSRSPIPSSTSVPDFYQPAETCWVHVLDYSRSHCVSICSSMVAILYCTRKIARYGYSSMRLPRVNIQVCDYRRATRNVVICITNNRVWCRCLPPSPAYHVHSYSGMACFSSSAALLLLLTSFGPLTVETCVHQQTALEIKMILDNVIEIPRPTIDCVTATTITMNSNTLTATSGDGDIYSYRRNRDLNITRFSVTNGASGKRM